MFSFREGFRLGVATASTQIEGGELGSNWNAFSAQKKIKDGSDVARANQHYTLYAEDARLLAELGLKDYRLSPEWARIEPREGEFDPEALRHYRTELELLREKGIRPLLTLYHFSHPGWFEEKGGFARRENLAFFFRYVERCLEAFGELCDDYVTINEPNVFAVSAYLFGEWPPEKKSLRLTLRVMNVFIEAHLRSYLLIHAFRAQRGWTDTRVSFAHHMRVFTPLRAHGLDRLAVRAFNFLFQDGLMRACFKGEFCLPFRNPGRLPQGRYIDFIAINYYSRGHLRGFSDLTPEGLPVNDLGWEIYPEGLLECARRCHACLPLPIAITENGTCDNEDRFRARYLYEHLERIAASELPIEAYYHWCFVDNFEWKEGESARFGLIHCDYETQSRTIKDSGRFYAQMIRDGGVTEDSFQKFVADQRYTLAPSTRPRS